jgi:hypothetical protein
LPDTPLRIEPPDPAGPVPVEAMTDKLCRLQSTFLDDHIHLTTRRAAVGTIRPYDMEAVNSQLQPEIARPTGPGPNGTWLSRKSFSRLGSRLRQV